MYSDTEKMTQRGGGSKKAKARRSIEGVDAGTWQKTEKSTKE